MRRPALYCVDVRYLVLIVAAIALAACYTGPDRLAGTAAVADVGDAADEAAAGDAGAAEAAPGPSAASDAGLSVRQEQIVAAAREVLETQSTTVGGRTYSYDCSGTILTIYAHAGILLIDLFPHYSGNGVARLHGIATDYGLLHNRSLPEPGDLIFWDNTYDRNGDGSWNDPLTHAGIVLSVDADGTVEYVHHNYRQGIVTARMNREAADVYRDDGGNELNSPMRMASQRAANPDLWLSSHLFREFAAMHRIELQAAGAPPTSMPLAGASAPPPSTAGGAAVASAR